MKKIIAFIILVILVILVICLSFNYYKKQDAQSNKVNKLKTDLETSEILNEKSDNDKIEVEETDTNKKESTDSDSSKKESSDNDTTVEEDSEEETNLNVPDTASDDDNGFVKLNSFSVSSKVSSIKVGKSTKLVVNYYPENASIKDTTFISETKNICKVSSLGKVTGIKKGTCSIVVKVKDQNSQSLLLSVK